MSLVIQNLIKKVSCKLSYRSGVISLSYYFTIHQFTKRGITNELSLRDSIRWASRTEKNRKKNKILSQYGNNRIVELQINSIEWNVTTRAHVTKVKNKPWLRKENYDDFCIDTIIASCFIYRSQWAAENLPDFME